MHATSQQEHRTVGDYWRDVFAFDFRSLALFRMLLGVLLLADLALRLPVIVAMYTDQGVMTRSVLYDYYNSLSSNWEYGVWSLHLLSGELAFQYLLFAVAAIAALALLLGWKTRIAVIVSWILLASLHARNPLILTSGDTILKLSLFWSMFMPLGRTWSIDSRTHFDLKTKKQACVGSQYYSLATVGYVLQLILMYFFTGVAKCNSFWFSGEAMEYVLRLDIYILPLGSWLLEYPGLLVAVTYATLFLEVFGIWFLLSWKRNDMARLLVILSYWGFHIGIGLTMSIGLFPLICLAVWVPLIPSRVWQWKSKQQLGSEVVVDKASPVSLASNILILASIVFVTLINISNVNNRICQSVLPRAITPFGYWLNLDQRFQMFGHPPEWNPWFVYEATLRDGSQVDLLRSELTQKIVSVDHQRPESVKSSLPNHHWRKLHRNLVHPFRKDTRQALVDYSVRNWNVSHAEEKQIVRLQLTCYSEQIGPNYDGSASQAIVWGNYEDPDHAPGSKFDAAVDDLLDGLPF